MGTGAAPEAGTSAGAGTPVSPVSENAFTGGFLRSKGTRFDFPGIVGATVTRAARWVSAGCWDGFPEE